MEGRIRNAAEVQPVTLFLRALRITIVQNLRETCKVSGDRNYRIPRAKFARRAKARSPKP